MENDNDGVVIIGTEIDTSGVEKGLDDIEDIVKKEDIDIDLDLDVGETEKKVSKIGGALNKVVSKVGGGFGKIVSSFTSGLGGAAMASILAILGVIILAVKIITDAFKNLTTNNEKMKEQWTEIKNTVSNMMTQIGNALAQLLQPLIQWILDAIQKIVQYVGYLLKAWFNIDIFTKSMSKSLDKSNKSASKLRKTIAGFDEMNILNDNTASASGIADNINDNLLKPLSEMETPNWLKVLGVMGLKSALGQMAIIWKAGVSQKLQEWLNWLTDKSDWVHEHLGDTIGDIYDEFVRVLQEIKNYFDRTFDRIIEIYNIFGDFIKKVFAGDWEGAWEDIKNIFSIIWEQIIDIFGTFFKVIIPQKFQGFASKVGDLLWTALKWVLNKIIQRIENVINAPIKAFNFLSDTVKSLLGADIGKLELIKLPRLAKGGIINMPGKGVPVGSAIAGESGQEAVLPLTDSQQMELLGEAIGRYITINANIVNTMNGRVISRELQKIQNSSNFAYNR